ncbi:hypothetical protein BD769DRAFT_1677872 [Suillus cothurnatus]|nr:hypothetical protein BD769DRAFT_1677872 [Suillus cothurnatus]
MSPSPDSNGSLRSDSIISPSLDPFFNRGRLARPVLCSKRMDHGWKFAYTLLDVQIKVLQNDILTAADGQTNVGTRARFTSARLLDVSLFFWYLTIGLLGAAYTKLAESLSLTPDHVALSTLSPHSLPVTLKAKEIAVPSYIEDWKKLQEKPSTQLEKVASTALVVDKNISLFPWSCHLNPYHISTGVRGHLEHQ